MDQKHLIRDVFQEGKKVYFDSEKLPFKVMSVSDRYAICVRRLNRREDAQIIHNLVHMSQYFTFKDAYEAKKDCAVYTIVDFEENMRGTENLLFSIFDYDDKSDCERAIQMLDSGEMSLSKRNKIELNVKIS